MIFVTDFKWYFVLHALQQRQTIVKIPLFRCLILICWKANRAHFERENRLNGKEIISHRKYLI